MLRTTAILAVALLALAAVSAPACIKSSAPLAPASADGTYRFTGTIVTLAGAKISGARLTVTGGLNKDAQVTTDPDGHYAFTGLQRDSFNVLIEAPGYASITPTVDLFMDIDATFALFVAN